MEFNLFMQVNFVNELETSFQDFVHEWFVLARGWGKLRSIADAVQAQNTPCKEKIEQ